MTPDHPLAHLLAPVSPEQPCGQDLSYSAEFDAITQARRADDPSLDQGEWRTELKAADWPKVSAQCQALLQTHTKDLRLLGWLTEALTHLHGFEGMANGLALCAAACERYWADIHPLPDDGDPEQRIGNLSWLLTQLVSLALAHPLVDAGLGKRHGLREIEVARTRLASADPHGADATPAGLNADGLRKLLGATPGRVLLSNWQGARQARDELAALQAVVDAALGADGPGFVAARQALDDVIHAAERLAREGGALVGPSAATALTPSVAPDLASLGTSGRATEAWPGASQSLPVAGMADLLPGDNLALAPLRSRQQALQQLRQVAEFFRHTEPHSPVAYLADKAVQWGHMSLHEWLRVVVKDGGSLAQLEDLLGVAAEPGEPR